jgi:two-component system, NtrC family, nitrogen regulation response regulator NtrX
MDSARVAPEFGPLSGAPASSRSPRRILLVHGQREERERLQTWLREDGHEVLVSTSWPEANELGGFRPDIVYVDTALGLDLGRVLLELRRVSGEVPLVVLTPPGAPEAVLAALRAGALDCVVHPLERERARAAQRRAEERLELLSSLGRVPSAGPALSAGLAGRSRAMRELSTHVSKVVDRDVAVFLQGEPGSGVDLAARTIHQRSSRAGGPFLTFDCAAFDPSEHESQLVGRELAQGRSFRGALEQASGGVLYIDNIGRLSMPAQAALANYLATREFRRIEGASFVTTSCRIVASNDADLRALVARGAFREDLFFRLVVYPIRVPALRERSEDIPLVVGSLLRELGQYLGNDTPKSMTPDALEILTHYAWPGNVRELENVVQRSMLSSTRDTIGVEDLPSEVRVRIESNRPANQNAKDALFGDEIVPLRDIERRAIEHALRLTDGNVAIAAKKLGMGRATLYRRIASLEVSIRVA